jgi:hypothetical protein
VKYLSKKHFESIDGVNRLRLIADELEAVSVPQIGYRITVLDIT